MNFREAVSIGKKVQSEYWEKDKILDTSIFSDKLEELTINIICESAIPLTWKELLGDWKLCE